MKIKKTLEYELDAHVVPADEDNIVIVVRGVDFDRDDAEPFFTRRPYDAYPAGFDGLEPGDWPLDVLERPDPEAYPTEESILDAYFNSPYGVA